jgi:hypothetical protein
MRKSKALQQHEEELKKKYEVEDRIEQHLVLRRMSEGAHLYVGDQPYGPDSDVNAWTANLGVDKNAFERRVVGRDLKKMQARHWITYNRILDEFLLTDDGRQESQAYERALTKPTA